MNEIIESFKVKLNNQLNIPIEGILNNSNEKNSNINTVNELKNKLLIIKEKVNDLNVVLEKANYF